jgi:hypothetical protein
MLRRILICTFALIDLPILFFVALSTGISRRTHGNIEQYNVFWGTEPLLNYFYWSRATQSIFSESIYVSRYPSSILDQNKIDLVLFNANVPKNYFAKILFLINENIKFILFFIKVLRTSSLVCCSCEGFLFQHYKVLGFNYRVEYYLLKVAGIRLAVFPYGADSFVYSNVQNKNWLYGLLSDYPEAAKNQSNLERRLKFYVRKSDIFLPGIAMFDGMGRSDWITPSTLCIDTIEWSPRKIHQNKTFTVTHAPNHRAVKGTRYVIDAIKWLQESGHDVELRLIENVNNEQVRQILAEESDLHVDQLFADGYGLNALESMSLGLPTISNFQGEIRDFFDRWTFTKECPIVVSNEVDLAQTILFLKNNREKLYEIGLLSREYILKYHSYPSFSKNFHNILVRHDERFVNFINSSFESSRNA